MLKPWPPAALVAAQVPPGGSGSHRPGLVVYGKRSPGPQGICAHFAPAVGLEVWGLNAAVLHHNRLRAGGFKF